ncbi:Alpha/Beta hydrolase protein [Cristinia sonorae]|uniref:Alpha/Beta hydrolase protein n=1 Tax=Cristinia sonorae TaxID=1940300 RepID=A0A8K0ULF4_9AGAR|nr:Alpha/Beta hydrolase protein [Cristinia sonorae]
MLTLLDGVSLNRRHVLPDGAQLAYEVLGSVHLGHPTPIVLVGGASSVAGDWERLSTVVSQSRPVLVYDHRGIGNSTYSTSQKTDIITIETMARDLIDLIKSLEWTEVILCGFSMGGVITQQLLLLPFHPSHPMPLPFRVTHVLLTGTMATPIEVPALGTKSRPEGKLTDQQKYDIVREGVEMSFDPEWVEALENKERLAWWIKRMVVNRPARTIVRQHQAVTSFYFGDLHKYFPSIPVLIIHGTADEIVPLTAGQAILKKIPWARMVQIGDKPGQIPSGKFGHHWWEYFDVKVWEDVIENFVSQGGKYVKAKL